MKTKILLSMLFGFIVIHLGYAQTPSQRRARNDKPVEENETNKPLTVSETRKSRLEKQKKEAIFSDNAEDFQLNKEPEQWKNESAVILGQHVKYSYDSKSFECIEKTVIRRKIKILDKIALEKFSQFYFASNENTDLAIKIIKPNNQEVDIEMQKAIKVDNSSDVPTFYKNFVFSIDSYKKLAVPGLEVGDIIDFYYLFKRTYITAKAKQFDFPPVIFQLANEYPTVNQIIEFEVERNFYINFISLNGAQKIVSSKVDRKNYNYQLTDKMREKKLDERWSYPFRSLPSIKFQVIYSSIKPEKSNYLLGELGTPKSKVTPDEVVDKAHNILIDYSSHKMAKGIASDAIASLRKQKIDYKRDKSKALQEAYYFFRNYFFINNPKNSYSIAGTWYQSDDEILWYPVMSKILEELEIPYEVGITVPRNVGSLDQLILIAELEMFYIVKIPEGDVYLFPFSKWMTYGQIPGKYESNDAYSFKPYRGDKNANYKKIKIPVTSHENNTRTEKFNITINDNLEDIDVKSEAIAKGLFKYDFYSDVIYENDNKEMEDKYYKKEEEKVRGNKNRIAEEKRKEEEVKLQNQEKKIETLQKDLKSRGFNIKNTADFELISNGRMPNSNELSFKLNFTLSNTVNKAGKNIIVQIGKLIGEQATLSKEEQNRQIDIYHPFERSMINTITLTIPEGYKIDDVSSLNSKYENASIDFITYAKIEGKTLTVNVTKSYKKLVDSKQDWNLYIEGLKKATDFYDKKVILKPLK